MPTITFRLDDCLDEDVSVHGLLHPEDTLPGREIRDNGEGTTAG